MMRVLHTNNQAFTIVEVLIVLAVSSVILLSAILLVNGRVNKTEFTVALNEVNSEIQSVINEVSAGYYPLSSNLSCQYLGGGSPEIDISNTNTRGTNAGCSFLGLALQFQPAKTPNPYDTNCQATSGYPSDGSAPYGQNGGSLPDPEEYFVYPLVGLTVNKNDNTQLATNLNQSGVLSVAPDCDAPSFDGTGIDDKSVGKLEYGLTAVSMCYANANPSRSCPTDTVGAIAFITSQQNDTTSSGGASQASHVDVYPVRCTALGDSEQQAVEQLDDIVNANSAASDETYKLSDNTWECPPVISDQPHNQQVVNPDGGIQICFKSGTTKESGLITISPLAGNLTTTVKRFSNTSCT